MNNQDYEQKKRECWEEFCKEHPLDATANGGVAFRYAFDRAFALGREFGNSEQVDIEEAAEKHADEMSVPSNITGALVPMLHDIAKSSYLQGVQDFIGKQESKQEIKQETDAEGEENEMLYVSRKRVQEMYAYNEDILSLDPTHSGAILLKKRLQDLFGSKCLPDEVSEVKRNLSENLSEPKPAEPEEEAVAENATTTQKPAEPKYHPGQKVCYNGYVYEVEGLVGKNRYAIKGLNYDLDEGMIEPYTELEEEIRNSRISPSPSDDSDNSDLFSSTNSADCEKMIDTVLNDIFSKERRLNIAATIAAGMAAGWYHEPQSGSLNDKCQRIAKITFMLADALIAEAEFPTDPLRSVKKGGTDD